MSLSLNPQMGPGGAAGSYSVSDQGCQGDHYAVSPTIFPAPGFLREYDSLRKALRVSVDTCALQSGPCWILRASQLPQRCGQACNGGCPTPGPTTRNGFAGYPDAVRREVEAAWKPIARVSRDGVSLVPSPGCVLPLWQRIYYVGDIQNNFSRQKPGMVYQAAVEAARYLAKTQGKTRVIFGVATNGRTVPVTYVQPGGIVKSARGSRGPATVVDPVSDFELRQYMAASQGASFMPFRM